MSNNNRTQAEFYKEANEYISKEIDKIEKWLKALPTHPHVEYMLSVKISNGVVQSTDMVPEVVNTVNKDAMLSEWSSIRAEIEWFNHVPKGDLY